MANRYLVAAGTWNNSNTAIWSATDGGASGASAPTTSDNVFLTAASGAVTVTTAGTATAGNVDCTGFTGTLSWGGATSTTWAGSFKLVAGMTVSGVAFSTQTFTGAGSFQLTCAGKQFGNLTINAPGGTYQLQDDITIGSTGGATLTHTAGTLDTNGKTVLCGGFNSNNTNTRTLTLGSSSITCSTTSPWNVNATNLTVSANTATVTCSASGASFITWQTFNWNGMSVVFTGGTANTGVTTNLTFANFTFTGTAVKTGVLTLYGNITCTGTFACNGNSTTNRVLVASNTVGTARTITAATVSCSNVDFRDITGAGAGSWNLSAITGLSGDCGGNSGITFTSPTTQTSTGTASFTWSTHGWTSRVPLPQDDVVISNAFIAGRTVTQDMPRMGKNVTTAGSSGSFTFSISAGGTAADIYGNLTITTGCGSVTMTTTVNFIGAANQTITTNGVTFAGNSVVSIFRARLQMQDAWTMTSGTSGLQTTLAGYVDTQSFNLQTGLLSFGNTSNQNLLGTSTITCTSTTNGPTLGNSTTTSAGSATIVIGAASASTRSISLNSNTIGTLTYTVAGSTGKLSITSSGTIGALNFSDASNARTLRFQSGITCTIRDGSLFNVNGTAGNLMSIDTQSAGSPATLAITTGTVSCDYLSVKDNTASGTVPAYAGANGVLVSGTTNWLASSPPSSGTPNLLLMGIG